MRQSLPPLWAAALLDRVLPRGARGSSVRADLDDEFRELATRVSLRVVRRWYAWEALKITAHFAWVGAWGGLRGIFNLNRTSGGVGGMERTVQNLRLALGAESTSVASRTILRGMIPVGLGVSLGLLGAALGAGLLKGLIFGVETLDLGTYLTAPATLVLVALPALALQALRASRIDPVRTLREE